MKNNTLCTICNNPFSSKKDINAKLKKDRPQCPACTKRECVPL